MAKPIPRVAPVIMAFRPAREKESQIENLENLHRINKDASDDLLSQLQAAALTDDNVFQLLLETTKSCSLGQITHALFAVGGKYRRNM